MSIKLPLLPEDCVAADVAALVTPLLVLANVVLHCWNLKRGECQAFEANFTHFFCYHPVLQFSPNIKFSLAALLGTKHKRIRVGTIFIHRCFLYHSFSSVSSISVPSCRSHQLHCWDSKRGGWSGNLSCVMLLHRQFSEGTH